jgi:hypothetical protein
VHHDIITGHLIVSYECFHVNNLTNCALSPHVVIALGLSIIHPSLPVLFSCRQSISKVTASCCIVHRVSFGKCQHIQHAYYLSCIRGDFAFLTATSNVAICVSCRHHLATFQGHGVACQGQHVGLKSRPVVELYETL